MKIQKPLTNQKGFSLLFIVLVFSALVLITVGAATLVVKLQSVGNERDTIKRMNVIRDALKKYYRGHQNLPQDATDPNKVPVAALNLEQKYRLDGWGRYLYYNRVQNAAVIIDGITFSAMTDINGLTVDGKSVAGVIISSGPDQTFQSTGPSPTYSTTDDDIIIPINVSQEAIEMALDDLKVLQAKLKAFDAFYKGIDNDNNGSPSSVSDCFAIVAPDCPGITPTFLNDPDCGTATLDAMLSAGMYESCAHVNPSTTSNIDKARDFICNFYSLADGYRIDPWLNGYVWGDTAIYSGDPREHKFFSAGPDDTAGTSDDIIP